VLARIDLAANPRRVVLRILRRRGHGKDAPPALAGGAVHAAPGVRPRRAFPKPPTSIEGVIDCFADVLVRMIVHGYLARRFVCGQLNYAIGCKCPVFFHLFCSPMSAIGFLENDQNRLSSFWMGLKRTSPERRFKSRIDKRELGRF
jgi:hypothetical protein